MPRGSVKALEQERLAKLPALGERAIHQAIDEERLGRNLADEGDLVEPVAVLDVPRILVLGQPGEHQRAGRRLPNRAGIEHDPPAMAIHEILNLLGIDRRQVVFQAELLAKKRGHRREVHVGRAVVVRGRLEIEQPTAMPGPDPRHAQQALV